MAIHSEMVSAEDADQEHLISALQHLLTEQPKYVNHDVLVNAISTSASNMQPLQKHWTPEQLKQKIVATTQSLARLKKQPKIETFIPMTTEQLAADAEAKRAALEVRRKAREEAGEDSNNDAEDDTDSAVPEDEREGEESEELYEANQHVPDVDAMAEMLEQAGVVLDENTCFDLRLALMVLMRQPGLEDVESVRFFGVIYALECNYYIVEVKAADNEEFQNDDPTMEPPGAPGANEYTYYVTRNLISAEWQKLPHLTPVQLRIARNVRRHFSGRLKEPVLGFPRFPWNEDVLLRCTIARITASTVVCPKGAFVFDQEEEEPVVIDNEQFAGLSAADLAHGKSWTHARQALLKEGRVEPYISEEEHDIDEDDTDAIARARDIAALREQPPPQLRSLDHDRLANNSAAWSFRISDTPDEPSTIEIPDQTVHKRSAENAVNPKIPVTYQFASAHSLAWPGAVTVAKNNKYISIYIGDGLRTLTAPFTPLPPAPFQAEFSGELLEQEDPTTAPVESDAEGDAEGEE